jgi:hypothetical protein
MFFFWSFFFTLFASILSQPVQAATLLQDSDLCSKELKKDHSFNIADELIKLHVHASKQTPLFRKYIATLIHQGGYNPETLAFLRRGALIQGPETLLRM